MKRTLVLAVMLAAQACIVGGSPAGSSGSVTGDGTEHGNGTGTGTGNTGTEVHIRSNTTWTGNQMIDAPTTIDPGVTLTVSAGTVVTFKAGTSLTIAGTLDAQGTRTSKITFSPGAAPSFGPITVPTGGKLKFSYVEMTGAELQTSGTGNVTITDSELSKAPGDLLVMNGGTMSFDYSNIGIEGGVDTTHCNMHFAGTGTNTIHVTHSNIRGVAFGVMFYSGVGANFTYNNWSNITNVDPTPGSVTGDFQNSYFKSNPPPAVSGITVTTPALNAALALCTGSNDTTCAGPRP